MLGMTRWRLWMEYIKLILMSVGDVLVLRSGGL